MDAAVAFAVGAAVVVAACLLRRGDRPAVTDVLAFAAAGAVLGESMLGVVGPAAPGLAGATLPAAAAGLSLPMLLRRDRLPWPATTTTAAMTLTVIGLLVVLGATVAASVTTILAAVGGCALGMAVPPSPPRGVPAYELAIPMPLPVVTVLGTTTLPVVLVGRVAPEVAAWLAGGVLAAVVWVARRPLALASEQVGAVSRRRSP